MRVLYVSILLGLAAIAVKGAEPAPSVNERAVALYTEAIALRPDDSLAYYQRGVAYARLGRLHEALADFNESIRIEPKAARSYSNRGNVYGELRQFDKAIADYDHALRLDSKLGWAHTNRGNAYALSGNYEKALADYEAAIRLDPKDAGAWNLKGWLLATCPKAELRSGEKAVECAAKACLLTNWKDAEAIESLAAAQAEAGEFGKAVQTQQEALKVLPATAQQGAQTRLEMYKSETPYRMSPPRS